MTNTLIPVYLAGDLVFRPDAPAIFERLKAICADYGLQGVAPLDGQEETRAMPPGRETIMAIVKADRALMDRCDGGIFCIDPFRRSPEMDPGTAVEIGYMHGLGKPMEGYTVDGRGYPEKVETYWREAWNARLTRRKEVDAPASGADEDPDGMLVHSDGLLQNGMVEGFIAFSGGEVAVNADFYTAFRQAAARLAQRVTA